MRKAFHAVLAVIVCGVFTGYAGAGEDPTGTTNSDVQIKELVREAVDSFLVFKAYRGSEKGTLALAEARKLLDEALKLNPTDRVFFELFNEVGYNTAILLIAEKRLGRLPSILMTSAKQYRRKLKRGDKQFQKRMARWVDDAVNPRTSYLERQKLFDQLSEYDQYVIPHLVKHLLTSVLDNDRKGYARITAQKMGSPAVLPLIELLEHPDLSVKQNATLALGNIQPLDPRSVAALMRVQQDSTEDQTLRNYAARSLRWITGHSLDELKDAKHYYLRKADRYFRDMASVQSEVETQEGVLWHLDNENNLKAVFLAPPEGDWTWNEIMAEEALRDALTLDPNYEPALLVYAATLASIIAEQRDMQDVKAEAGENRMTAQQRTFIDEHEKKMFRYSLMLSGLGPTNLYRGLNKCLYERRPETAVVLMEHLQELDVAMKGSAGNMLPPPNAGPKGHEGWPLARALDDPDERIRFQAAITLAHMNPANDFYGSEKVTSILAEGINESGPFSILVVTENNDEKNRYQQLLGTELQYIVSFASDGMQGLASAANFPPKDLVIVSDRLEANLTTRQFIEEMADSQTTRSIPIAVLINSEDLADTRKKLGGSQPDGYILRSDTEGKLQKAVEQLGTTLRAFRGSVNKFHKNELAAKSAAALAAIDPIHTHMAYDDDKCDTALLGALTRRPNLVRLPVIRALGVWSRDDSDILRKMEQVFNDKATDSNDIYIRRALVKSLAQINPKDASVRNLLLKIMLSETDHDILKWAAVGYGRFDRGPKGGPSPDQATQWGMQNRVDKSRYEN